MFWSDVAIPIIYRARENGREATVMVSTNITTPGICVRVIGQRKSHRSA